MTLAWTANPCMRAQGKADGPMPPPRNNYTATRTKPTTPATPTTTPILRQRCLGSSLLEPILRHRRSENAPGTPILRRWRRRGGVGGGPIRRQGQFGSVPGGANSATDVARETCPARQICDSRDWEALLCANSAALVAQERLRGANCLTKVAGERTWPACCMTKVARGACLTRQFCDIGGRGERGIWAPSRGTLLRRHFRGKCGSGSALGVPMCD